MFKTVREKTTLIWIALISPLAALITVLYLTSIGFFGPLPTFEELENPKNSLATEIISENEFFDYDAKYKGQSNEITPADISTELENNIKDLTYRVYDMLGMKGIARMDYIVNDKGTPYLIEINSVPGMSKESIVPQMANCKKLKLKDLF